MSPWIPRAGFAFPARYRQGVVEASGGLVVCTAHPHGCVLIYTSREDMERTREDVVRQHGSRDAQRIIEGNATDVPLDAAGRLRVPSPIRDFCGLQRQATLMALAGAFELWDTARWHERALKVSASESMSAVLSAVKL